MSIPDRPPLRRAQGAKWVDPGGVVKVRDVQIGSGLFYLGDALAMPDASVIDQYAVNPDLSVSAGRGARQPVDAVLAVLSCVGDRADVLVLRCQLRKSQIDCSEPRNHRFLRYRRGRSGRVAFYISKPSGVAAPRFELIVRSRISRTVITCFPITAPVSHQKRPQRDATNALDFSQMCRKINGSDLYSAAHNGLVGGSNPPGPTTQSRDRGDFPETRE